MKRDRNGIECPQGYDLISVTLEGGERVDFFQPIAAVVASAPIKAALDTPRSKAEGDADLADLALRLGTSQADASRRAVAVAVALKALDQEAKSK